MFTFIYISSQAEKHYHCPKEIKMLMQGYKNRNRNNTLKKQGSCQKIKKHECEKEELAHKINKLTGV